MHATSNAARKLRPVPPPANLAPHERQHSPLAGFIVCTFTGCAFGFAVGILTSFAIWHH